MRAHLEAWMTRVWEKHNGTGCGPGDSQAQRFKNIDDAIEGVRLAYSKKNDVEKLTKNLRDPKKKDRLAPLFEQALRKETDCD